MITGYPQGEENNPAIAGYLAVCGLICGLAVFGFYKLMQPTQYANPGLAAYKLPPGIVHPLAARSYEQPVVSVAIEPPTPDIADETTGRAVQTVTTSPAVARSPSRQVAVAPSPVPHVAVAPSPSTEVPVAPSPPTQIQKEPKAKAVAVRSDSPKTRQTTSTHSYPSRTFFGPYAGYATIN